LAAAYASFPIILAVCALTALVAYNYIVVCRQFPDGGGVYSSARLQSRFLAVMGFAVAGGRPHRHCLRERLGGP